MDNLYANRVGVLIGLKFEIIVWSVVFFDIAKPYGLLASKLLFCVISPLNPLSIISHISFCVLVVALPLSNTESSSNCNSAVLDNRLGLNHKSSSAYP